MRMLAEHDDDDEPSKEVQRPSRGRATRRQKVSDLHEAAESAMPERFAEAATDRRGGWRASKAKGTRRNRRYEKRLLSGAAGGGVSDLWEEE